MTRVERILGVTEEELVRQGPEERQQYICKQVAENGIAALHFVNVQTGSLTPIGSFSTPTLEELQDQVSNQESEEKDLTREACPFYCLYKIDIGEFQTRLPPRSMVQIAGNFNCINVSSRKRKPDDGRMVELAFQQKTQGPAATFGPLAANLYRTHFCIPPAYSGQTLKHQINLLENVMDYTGHPINGKLTLTGEETPIAESEMDCIAQQVKVGLQTDCHVMYGRNKKNREVCLLNRDYPNKPQDFSKLPRVDQCHVAAVNWKSLTEDQNRDHTPAWTQTAQKQREIYALSSTLLRAAYEGVYLAALSRRTQHLYLTLVGGGVFGNPNPLIVQELARAHEKWANHPASCLQGVYLCAYSPKDNVEHLLQQEGIKIVPTSSQ